MSNNLYEEAINAAELIKEAAEQKVKQQLIEAMSPKIKQLVESNILEMNEDSDECGEGVEESDELADGVSDADLSAEISQNVESDEAEDESDDNVKEVKEDEEEKFLDGLTKLQAGHVSEGTKTVLKKLITEKTKKIALKNKIDEVKEAIQSLKKVLLLSENRKLDNKTIRKIAIIHKNLLSELKNIKRSNILKTDNLLLKEFLQISKEIKNMSRRRSNKRGYLNESIDEILEMNLFEADEEDEKVDSEEGDSSDPESEDMPLDMEDMGLEDEDEVEAEEEGEEEEDMESGDAEVSKSAAQDAIDTLQSLLDGMDSEDDSEEDMELADDESAMYEIASLFEEDEMDGDEEDEMAVEEDEMDGDEVYEIDESMLRREISRMKALREGDAAAMASHFGGGKAHKEMFVDADELKDLNVHADHLGREDVPSPKVEALIRKVVRNNRMLEGKTQQYKEALRGMKNQLAEMNLFNAKLLYANKLMQNRELSIKQQKHIVESLDNAATLGEAKILFESLSKSLSKTRTSGNLAEGTTRRTLSSSSRPTRSAQTMNESVALDRWATLAGIKTK